MCLPSDTLLQHLPSYLCFSYLGRGVSLHGCSSKAQPLLLTLDEGCLHTATIPDLQRGIAPLGPPVPVQQQYVNREHPDVQAGFRKGRGTRDQLPTSTVLLKKQESSRKTSISAYSLTKPLTVWITTNCGKFLKRIQGA